MRTKSQSVQVVTNSKLQATQELDYNFCIYSCTILRKKFLGVAPRYFYLFPEQIAICKVTKIHQFSLNQEEKKKLADRVFSINSDLRVQWVYKNMKNDQKLLKGVKFLLNNQEFEYLAEETILEELKTNIASYVFQSKIQEEYQAESIIDRGSYATVLELTKISNKQQFAAKCIDQKKILEKQNALKQLNYEIQCMRILATGKHPNILNLRELYIGNSNFYIVMDLAQGGSLLSVMKKRETLFERKEIKLIMKQLLEGIAYMHSFNLMHRDLKPENILFLKKNDLNSLKIADFGLAQDVDTFPFLYPKCGTPGFVAPEILNQSGAMAKYGLKCDIFSCGVILYILLTGEPLFDAKDKKDLLDLNKKCEFDITKVDRELINKTELDFIVKMIKKDPQQRLSAKECLEHSYFQKDESPDIQFQSEDFNLIESELDINQQNNIQQFMKHKMNCFQLNPFIQTNNNSIRTKSQTTVQQTSHPFQANNSMLIRTNLKLDKDSIKEDDSENDEDKLKRQDSHPKSKFQKAGSFQLYY